MWNMTSLSDWGSVATPQRNVSKGFEPVNDGNNGIEGLGLETVREAWNMSVAAA